MRPVSDENELSSKILEGRREAQSAFGNDEGYLEKLIEIMIKHCNRKK